MKGRCKTPPMTMILEQPNICLFKILEEIKIIATNIFKKIHTYIARGNLLSVVDDTRTPITDPTHPGLVNHFRFKSYYWDSETELYALQTRYYSPEWGRFVNADGIMGANQDILGYNLYAYVSNNPVNFSDPSGLLSVPFGPNALADFQNRYNNAAAAGIPMPNNPISGAKNTLTAPDYSAPINQVVKNNITTVQVEKAYINSSILSLSYFYDQVDKGGPWDYKLKDQWKNGIDASYLGLYGVFIWDGQAMNAEQFGNMHYGIVGTAMGYSPTMLFMGGGYADKGKSFFMYGSPYWGDSRQDHFWIQKGINYYNCR